MLRVLRWLTLLTRLPALFERPSSEIGDFPPRVSGMSLMEQVRGFPLQFGHRSWSQEGPAKRRYAMARLQTTPCVHRWVLSEPDMTKVRGVCRRCGARRTYPSGLELPEAMPDYDQLAASRPVLAAESASPEEHALV